MAKKKEPRKNFRSNLARCCATDKMRPVQNRIAFIDGMAVATNAYLIIESDLKLHGFTAEEIAIMNGKQLHRTTFALIYKEKSILVTELGFKNLQGVIFPFCQENEQFPDYKNVIPKFPELPTDCCFVNCISIDYKLIKLLGDALIKEREGISDDVNTGLIFTFLAKNRIIRIQHQYIREGQTGYIMPIMLEYGVDPLESLTHIKMPQPSTPVIPKEDVLNED